MRSVPVATTYAEVQDIVNQIRDMHRQRQALIKARTRLTNQILATWRDVLEDDDRSRLGNNSVLSAYTLDGETGRRTSPYATMSAKRLASLGAVRLGDEGIGAVSTTVLALETAAGALTEHIESFTKKMEQLVQRLPVWQLWGAEVRGFGAVSLALIVAEASAHDGVTLSDYPTVAKLWKRMGVGLVQHHGEWIRQRKVALTSAEEAYAIGYKPMRRSMLFVVGDTMIKGNHAKGDDGAYEDLPYRQVYLERKVYEDARLSPDIPVRNLIIHRRAQRYMEKRLLRDLWRAWREYTPPPDGASLSA